MDATSPARASNRACGSYAQAQQPRGDLRVPDTQEGRESVAAVRGEWHREHVRDERPLQCQGGRKSNLSPLGSRTTGDLRGQRSRSRTIECSNETLLPPQRSGVLAASPAEDLSLDTRAHIFPIARR